MIKVIFKKINAYVVNEVGDISIPVVIIEICTIICLTFPTVVYLGGSHFFTINLAYCSTQTL